MSFIAFIVVSCSEEIIHEPHVQSGTSLPLEIYATLNGSGNISSRAETNADHDNGKDDQGNENPKGWLDMWSYVNFTGMDEMGFYSSHGNSNVNDGKGAFVNQKLQYDGSIFRDPEGGASFSPTYLNGSEIYMYFPYDANIGGAGMKLRVDANDGKDGSEPEYRCVDFLSATNIAVQGVLNGENTALFGNFKHAFSELIIVRGEGFDSPPNGLDRITAVINKSVTHIKVTENSGDEEAEKWVCTPSLVYVDDPVLTEEKARQWDAWKGGNYALTEEDKVGREASYVIVPTMANQRSIVEYIELYDNEGNLQRVSSLRLSGGNTKYVDPGWCYPMEITMKELVPTVNPFRVIPWNSDVNLTDERKRGINNIAEFDAWLRAYNAYLSDGNAANDQSKINALLNFGDSYVDSNGNRSWHFYVLSDLDMTAYTPSIYGDVDNSGIDYNVVIQQLCDTLDGISTTLENHKFINHTIKGLSKTFIEKLSPNGVVQNIDFIEPEVHIKDEVLDMPVGIIANQMDNASVVNCAIEDGELYNPNGPAGMIAGEMKGGKIEGCTVSGFMIAKETITEPVNEKGIVGKVSDNPTFNNNIVRIVYTNENP